MEDEKRSRGVLSLFAVTTSGDRHYISYNNSVRALDMARLLWGTGLFRFVQLRNRCDYLIFKEGVL